MQTFDRDPIDERQLDELLRKAFLSEPAEEAPTLKLNDMTATAIFSSEHFVLPVSKAESRFLNRFTGSHRKTIWWKHPGFLAGLFLAATLIVLLLFRLQAPAAPKNQVPVATPAVQTPGPGKEKIAPALATESGKVLPGKEKSESFPPMKKIPAEVPMQTDSNLSIAAPVWPALRVAQLPEKPADDFPVLTAREMEQNEKRKDKMLNAVLKHDKTMYTLIPAGKFRYKGRAYSLPAFYMERGEVTNSEYKTFLIDLVVQGRKADYLKSRPDNGQWTRIGIPSYTRRYFYDKKFDDHPVVNIPKAGAELYCEWLAAEVLKKGKEKGLAEYAAADAAQIRIPTEQEWAYAGKSGNDSGIYANGMRKLENLKGCELCNYKVVTEGEKPRQVLNKKLTAPDEKRSRYVAPDSTVITPAKYKFCGEVDSLNYYSVPVYSFNPNDFGLYCMAGNVAEMVYAEGSQQIRTIGGGWNSTRCHLVLEAPDEFAAGPELSPFVGFRTVFSLPQGIKK